MMNEPMSPVESRLLDQCEEMYEYLNELSERINLLAKAILSLERRFTMPLVKGKKASSKKGFSENVKREMHEGKPQKQAVAIAYSEARRGKKKKKEKK